MDDDRQPSFSLSAGAIDWLALVGAVWWPVHTKSTRERIATGRSADKPDIAVPEVNDCLNTDANVAKSSKGGEQILAADVRSESGTY